MTRDYDEFPDDENGQVLWNLWRSGDRLKKPREIDFSVIFPNEEVAMTFAIHLLRNGQKVSYGPYEGNDEMPWQVQVHPVMIPRHRTITEFEAQLASDAAALGGRNEGWGCVELE